MAMERLTKKLRRRAMRLPMWLVGIIYVTAFGLTGWWWLRYSGPYRWLAELQLQKSGSYGLVLTGLMLLLACMLVATGLVQLLATFAPEPSDSERQADENATKPIERLNVWMNTNQSWLVAIGVTVSIAVIGGYMVIEARLGGKIADVQVRDLEQGADPPGRFVKLAGRLLPREMAVFERNRGARFNMIVPVVSSDWQEGRPVAAFLRLEDVSFAALLERIRSGQLTAGLFGLLSPGDLPGIARTEMEGRGLKIADRHFVLDQGQTPESRESLGMFLLPVSAVMGVGVALVWLIRRRRAAG
jgi:hypothetical protein